VVRVYDDAGNVIETHEHKGDFKEWQLQSCRRLFSGAHPEVHEVLAVRGGSNDFLDTLSA
jgi:hypothetical protein